MIPSVHENFDLYRKLVGDDPYFCNVLDVPGDGSCLYHAYIQVRQMRESPSTLRKKLAKFMESNPSTPNGISYKDFLCLPVDEDRGIIEPEDKMIEDLENEENKKELRWNRFLTKVKSNEWGGSLEIMGLVHMYKVTIHVLSLHPNHERIVCNEFPASNMTSDTVYIGHLRDGRKGSHFVALKKKEKGNTEKGNMKFKRYEGSTFEKERVMIKDGDRPAGFRKGEQDMQRLIVSDVKSKASQSIGLVWFKESKQGTCFRVGDNYVMTNVHVIKSIITGDGRGLTENLKIVFEYKIDEVVPSLEDKRTVFDLETEITYRNDTFDVVLLQLKTCAVYPPPLTLFGKLHYDEPVYLIGHSGGDVMLEDCVQLMEKNETLAKKINVADSYLKDKYKTSINYYTHLFSDQNIVIFNTAFMQGSSGSPGIVVATGKPCVILILSGGVPTCYYEDRNKYRSLPNEFMFEFGYSMKDVSEEMKNTHPHLEKKHISRLVAMIELALCLSLTLLSLNVVQQFRPSCKCIDVKIHRNRKD